MSFWSGEENLVRSNPNPRSMFNKYKRFIKKVNKSESRFFFNNKRETRRTSSIARAALTDEGEVLRSQSQKVFFQDNSITQKYFNMTITILIG